MGVPGVAVGGRLITDIVNKKTEQDKHHVAERKTFHEIV